MKIKRYFVGSDIRLFTSATDFLILLGDHGLSLKESIATLPCMSRDGAYYWNRPYPADYRYDPNFEFEDIDVTTHEPLQ